MEMIEEPLVCFAFIVRDFSDFGATEGEQCATDGRNGGWDFD